MPEHENNVLPPGTNDSWRTWLMTGVRRAPVDRRRVRGDHKGIKKMLAEGMSVAPEHPHRWKEFSDAMVRQSVGDAMGSLQPRDAQVVKLAYFGGMSNHEIAERLGVSVAAVERRLRAAITLISRHVERSRQIGRRAIGAVVVWLGGRWIGDAVHHAVQASAVAAAVVVVAAAPATLESPGRPGSATHPARVAAGSGGSQAQKSTYAPPSPQSPPDLTVPKAPVVSVPIALHAPVGSLTRKLHAVGVDQLPLRS